MSGITGYVGKSKNVIQKMSQKIEHRGPDKEIFIKKDDLNVCYRFLDTNKYHKSLPFETNEFIFMYDGFIYNKEELEKELNEKTDLNNLIVKLFKKYNTNCFKYLKGNFTIFIYNKKTKTTYLARDHFGVKPMYYSLTSDTLIFSSELKSLVVHPDVKKIFNEKILKAYLEFSFTPTSETFFENVYSLDPGSVLIFKDELTIKKYFELNFYENSETKQEDFNKLFKNICFKYKGDAPIGSFLSSGIDSSYIVSVLKPKHTYTIGYDDKRYSESNEAKDLADLLNINNTLKIVSKNEYFDVLDEVLYYLDEPSADPAIVSLYLASKEASKDIKVIFSGEGADEFFGGYNRYNEEYTLSFYNKIPFFIRKIISSILKKFNEVRGINFLVRRGEKLEDTYIGVNRSFSNKQASKLLKKDIKYIESKDLTKDTFDKFENSSSVVKMQAVDIKFWLLKDILLKADRMTISSSLDVRSPFVDQNIFNYAKHLTKEEKISKTETKITLRKAAQKEIPNESYNKKKLGFPVPLREWLKEEDIVELIKIEFSSDISKELFKEKELNKMLSEFLKGKKDNYREVWTIFIILRWYKLNFAN